MVAKLPPPQPMISTRRARFWQQKPEQGMDISRQAHAEAIGHAVVVARLPIGQAAAAIVLDHGDLAAARPHASGRAPDSEQIAVYRQGADPHAGGGGDGIDQRRRSRGAARFADAAGRLAALDDVHIDHGRLVDPHHAIVVEIGLLTRPFATVMLP